MTRVRAELTESRGEPHLHGAGSGKPVAGDGPVEDTALHALAARFRSLLHGGSISFFTTKVKSVWERSSAHQEKMSTYFPT